jgi:hypothetical protein
MSDSCDFTAPSSRNIDATLAQMRAEWEAFARYAVYRSEWRAGVWRRTVLHTNQTLAEARALQARETEALRLEPGYRGGLMSSPLIGFELEDAEATKARYRARHQQPERQAA